jgi:hypothetical protein
MSSSSSSSLLLHTLLELLQEVLPVTENEATTTTTMVGRLAEWNDQMEPILFGPSCSGSSSESLSAEHDDDSVNAVSLHLQRLLLSQLLRHSDSDKEEEDGSGKNRIDWHALETRELATTVVAHFRGSDDDDDGDDTRACHHTVILTDVSALLKEVLRTCKNWLRWYLQIYIVSTNNKTAASNSLQQWQSHDMLELYILLLEQSVPEDPAVARLVSQLFFYASYDQSTVQGANDFIQHAYAFLVQDLQYFSRVLPLLVAVHNNMSTISTISSSSSSSSDSVPTDSAGSGSVASRWSAHVPLALSLVRNVHNILATYPSAKAAVEAVTIPCTCLAVLLDLLETVTHHHVTNSGPTESVNQEQQQQQQQDELTLEILRTFYALGVGHHLAAPVQDDRLARCLLELLIVDSNVPTAVADESVTAVGNVDIPLATLSVLMDASPTFSEYMVQQDAVQPVLSLLERQVTHIIETSLVDHRGAAACLPVLVVVHRCCQANLAFRKATKEAVFPVADEANFQRLVKTKQQEIKSSRDSGATTTGGAKDMKPLDAPVGTLRFKLIQLLTWPEGHVKRFAGEILWTLCGSEAAEFIFRVGMGNGMPFLGAKGMVEMPQQVFS